MYWIIAARGRSWVKLFQMAASGSIFGNILAEFIVVAIAASLFGEKLLFLKSKPTEEVWAKTRRLGHLALFLSIIPFSVWNFTIEKNKPIDDFFMKFGILSGLTLFLVFMALIAGRKCNQYSLAGQVQIDQLFDDSHLSS